MITITTAAAKATMLAAVNRCAGTGLRTAARGGASSRAQLIQEGESTMGGGYQRRA